MLTRGWPRGLLVSVRDAAEATVAVAAGAGVIDVKEPRHGPLGRPSAEVVAAVVGAVRDRAPVTIACGELAAADEMPGYVADLLCRLPPALPLPTAVKAGPAGLTLAAWRGAFRGFRAALPPGLGAVAVAYADWRRAEAPPPDSLLAEAIESGAAAFLVDTFDKRGPGLFETVSSRTVGLWSDTAARAGLTLAVAGRLAAGDVAAAFALGVPVVGVRSAACNGGRDGRLAAPRVRLLAKLGLRRAVGPPPIPRGVQVS